jgi:arsenate reductase-like glutaredoxin family protein
MKELKSKKTNKIQICSEEEFKQIEKNPELLKRFIITDMKPRSSPLKIELPKELKPKSKNK